MSADESVLEASPDAMATRRAVLGDAYVDGATKHSDPLTKEFQAFMTNYCWGEIWGDNRLSRAQHSLVVMSVTASLGRLRELEIHALGALRNGLTPTELLAFIRQIAVYAGVPAAVSALPVLRAAIAQFERTEE